eukprot:TRINITY_DN2457_c0_g1_i2.p2 TRINITY_DN2457_c0_g1~~TRINITY_DN2457_c0_g1_i2.p2  ORF type:complete len:80 (-),score=2.76 TRINITY_DN2457_c0_g1_i2:118-357(-)
MTVRCLIFGKIVQFFGFLLNHKNSGLIFGKKKEKRQNSKSPRTHGEKPLIATLPYIQRVLCTRVFRCICGETTIQRFRV